MCHIVERLAGPKGDVVVASGGTPVGSEIDFFTPWLRHFLALSAAPMSRSLPPRASWALTARKIEAAAQTIELLAA
ncbi:hypothetical protein ACSMXM_11905 [Pacificimonas sp. ICDLI1SI03]